MGQEFLHLEIPTIKDSKPIVDRLVSHQIVDHSSNTKLDSSGGGAGVDHLQLSGRNCNTADRSEPRHCGAGRGGGEGHQRGDADDAVVAH